MPPCPRQRLSKIPADFSYPYLLQIARRCDTAPVRPEICSFAASTVMISLHAGPERERYSAPSSGVHETSVLARAFGMSANGAVAPAPGRKKQIVSSRPILWSARFNHLLSARPASPSPGFHADARAHSLAIPVVIPQAGMALARL